MKHYPNKFVFWTEERGYSRGVLLPFTNASAPGVQIQLTEIPPGGVVGKHYHKQQVEFIVFLEGTCRYEFDAGQVEVGVGDMLVVDPREVHETVNIGPGIARFLTMKLNATAGDTVWLE